MWRKLTVEDFQEKGIMADVLTARFVGSSKYLESCKEYRVVLCRNRPRPNKVKVPNSLNKNIFTSGAEFSINSFEIEIEEYVELCNHPVKKEKCVFFKCIYVGPGVCVDTMDGDVITIKQNTPLIAGLQNHNAGTVSVFGRHGNFKDKNGEYHPGHIQIPIEDIKVSLKAEIVKDESVIMNDWMYLGETQAEHEKILQHHKNSPIDENTYRLASFGGLSSSEAEEAIPPSEEKVHDNCIETFGVSDQQVFEVLGVLKDLCKSHKQWCHRCPLRKRTGGSGYCCYLLNSGRTPAEWNIEPPGEYKAFNER